MKGSEYFLSLSHSLCCFYPMLFRRHGIGAGASVTSGFLGIQRRLPSTTDEQREPPQVTGALLSSLIRQLASSARFASQKSATPPGGDGKGRGKVPLKKGHVSQSSKIHAAASRVSVKAQPRRAIPSSKLARLIVKKVMMPAASRRLAQKKSASALAVEYELRESLATPRLSAANRRRQEEKKRKIVAAAEKKAAKRSAAAAVPGMSQVSPPIESSLSELLQRPVLSDAAWRCLGDLLDSDRFVNELTMAQQFDVLDELRLRVIVSKEERQSSAAAGATTSLVPLEGRAVSSRRDFVFQRLRSWLTRLETANLTTPRGGPRPPGAFDPLLLPPALACRFLLARSTIGDDHAAAAAAPLAVVGQVRDLVFPTMPADPATRLVHGAEALAFVATHAESFLACGLLNHQGDVTALAADLAAQLRAALTDPRVNAAAAPTLREGMSATPPPVGCLRGHPKAIADIAGHLCACGVWSSLAATCLAPLEEPNTIQIDRALAAALLPHVSSLVVAGLSCDAVLQSVDFGQLASEDLSDGEDANAVNPLGNEGGTARRHEDAAQGGLAWLGNFPPSYDGGCEVLDQLPSSLPPGAAAPPISQQDIMTCPHALRRIIELGVLEGPSQLAGALARIFQAKRVTGQSPNYAEIVERAAARLLTIPDIAVFTTEVARRCARFPESHPLISGAIAKRLQTVGSSMATTGRATTAAVAGSGGSPKSSEMSAGGRPRRLVDAPLAFSSIMALALLRVTDGSAADFFAQCYLSGGLMLTDNREAGLLTGTEMLAAMRAMLNLLDLWRRQAARATSPMPPLLSDQHVLWRRFRALVAQHATEWTLKLDSVAADPAARAEDVVVPPTLAELVGMLDSCERLGAVHCDLEQAMDPLQRLLPFLVRTPEGDALTTGQLVVLASNLSIRSPPDQLTSVMALLGDRIMSVPAELGHENEKNDKEWLHKAMCVIGYTCALIRLKLFDQLPVAAQWWLRSGVVDRIPTGVTLEFIASLASVPDLPVSMSHVSLIEELCASVFASTFWDRVTVSEQLSLLVALHAVSSTVFAPHVDDLLARLAVDKRFLPLGGTPATPRQWRECASQSAKVMILVSTVLDRSTEGAASNRIKRPARDAALLSAVEVPSSGLALLEKVQHSTMALVRRFERCAAVSETPLRLFRAATVLARACQRARVTAHQADKLHLRWVSFFLRCHKAVPIDYSFSIIAIVAQAQVSHPSIVSHYINVVLNARSGATFAQLALLDDAIRDFEQGGEPFAPVARSLRLVTSHVASAVVERFCTGRCGSVKAAVIGLRHLGDPALMSVCGEVCLSLSHDPLVVQQLLTYLKAVPGAEKTIADAVAIVEGTMKIEELSPGQCAQLLLSMVENHAMPSPTLWSRSARVIMLSAGSGSAGRSNALTIADVVALAKAIVASKPDAPLLARFVLDRGGQLTEKMSLTDLDAVAGLISLFNFKKHSDSLEEFAVHAKLVFSSLGNQVVPGEIKQDSKVVSAPGAAGAGGAKLVPWPAIRRIAMALSRRPQFLSPATRQGLGAAMNGLIVAKGVPNAQIAVVMLWCLTQLQATTPSGYEEGTTALVALLSAEDDLVTRLRWRLSLLAEAMTVLGKEACPKLFRTVAQLTESQKTAVNEWDPPSSDPVPATSASQAAA